MRGFDVDSLPRTVDLAGGTGLRGFPALVDEGDAVGIRICESLGEQAVTMARGTRRLLALSLELHHNRHMSLIDVLRRLTS